MKARLLVTWALKWHFARAMAWAVTLSMPLAMPLAMSLAMLVSGCGQPMGSGTSTNWLSACVHQGECDPSASCMCGLCTSTCSSDDQCSSGICGSGLGSTARCGEAEHPRICLPKPATKDACTEVSVLPSATLGPALEPRCAAPGALLCEDFDTALSSNYATWTSGETGPSVQDCRVHTGTGALRYHRPNADYSQTRMRLSTPVSSGPLYARFFAYVPSSVTIPTYLGMFELWGEDASSSGKISLEVIPDDVLEVYVTPQAEAYRAPAGSMPRDRWACIELALDVAAAGGTARVSLDGKILIERTGIVTLPPNPISVAVVEGLPSPDASGVDLTLDDLVVSTQPIGCAL